MFPDWPEDTVTLNHLWYYKFGFFKNQCLSFVFSLYVDELVNQHRGSWEFNHKVFFLCAHLLFTCKGNNENIVNMGGEQQKKRQLVIVLQLYCVMNQLTARLCEDNLYVWITLPFASCHILLDYTSTCVSYSKFFLVIWKRMAFPKSRYSISFEAICLLQLKK